MVQIQMLCFSINKPKLLTEWTLTGEFSFLRSNLRSHMSVWVTWYKTSLCRLRFQWLHPAINEIIWLELERLKPFESNWPCCPCTPGGPLGPGVPRWPFRRTGFPIIWKKIDCHFTSKCFNNQQENQKRSRKDSINWGKKHNIISKQSSPKEL